MLTFVIFIIIVMFLIAVNNIASSVVIHVGWGFFKIARDLFATFFLLFCCQCLLVGCYFEAQLQCLQRLSLLRLLRE